ncbi:MAG TPA: prolyl aminopeptidase [Beijerinckiaceae bacterium]|jgi:proline iminopeptidase|nr:prolyl aminopeptidase [Beijerinckiaceae bacterium]
MESERIARSTALYPHVEPYDSGRLDVGDGHRLYWEVCGNRHGHPALFLHGGPGGGCQADHRRLFDPDRYRIVLFDQRGGGRSQPSGSLGSNTTADLVSDIEKLRLHLGVEDWLVLGGSWGAALALAYAEAHRDRVRALVLRGVFSARRCEVDWLYRDNGAARLFPEAFARFAAPIPESERHDLVGAYHRKLMSGDSAIVADAAREWCAWESGLLTLQPRTYARSGGATQGEIALARIETHYFIHDCFLEEGQLLANAGRLAGIPGVIVQGRYDVVTPAATSFLLHRAWPGSTFEIVPTAGHATGEPGIASALVAATDHFAH